MNSAIYTGSVRHRRFGTPEHEFRYGISMLYVDLDEVDELFRGRLWSASPDRWAPGWFRRSDYLPPPLSAPGTGLPDAARSVVEAETGRRPAGPVRVLTHPRYWGLQFNPATFWYCYDADGRTLDAVVVEVTNTPWRERHSYVLDARDETGRAVLTAEHDKAFHVSPFLGMEQRYRWAFSAPGDRLNLHVANHASGDHLGDEGDGRSRVFDATLSLERRPWSVRERNRLLWRHPPMTVKVVAGIYWQALRLRLRGARYVPHPRTEVVA